MAQSEPNTIHILVATDNHVGFGERDPIRKDDSWRTFDEIMQIARKQDVDMVLLGGDLFHDNKPSRKSTYQVMRTLRQNCLGMRPCELEFLSDAKEIFEGSFTHVNWQDPDINISIPVFSIHGNHDDPTGDGHLCSLDLLQMAGLVNYFGRVPEADNIHVRPVLLQKGRTKLALYGISNVRDERMHRTFRDKKVHFYRPNQQRSDWFNLLTVHQNHHAHTATGHLPENMIPDFMNLVVWGHEHECRIEPQHNPETGFHVMQPGSSVATSLVPGEAVPKHVAVLHITGKDFQVDKIMLTTVRPFVIKEIILVQDRRFKALERQKDNRQEITKRLIRIVDEMIEEARDNWQALQDKNAGGDDDEAPEMPLPLVRLKVEYTAPDQGSFEMENPQRFSNRFNGRVANINDVVYFYRKKTASRRNQTHVDTQGLAETAEEMAIGEKQIRVHTIVQELLSKQSLKLLPAALFGDAVDQFVDKDDKHAIAEFVQEQLKGQVKALLDMGGDDGPDLDAEIDQVRQKIEKAYRQGQKKSTRLARQPTPDGWDEDLTGPWDQQPEAYRTVVVSQMNTSGGAAGRTVRCRPRTPKPDADDGGVLMSDGARECMQNEAPARRGAAAKSTSAAVAKKFAATKMTAATTTRAAAPACHGGKIAGPFPDRDGDDEYDVVMADEGDADENDEGEGEDILPVKKMTTRRAAASKRAQPTRGAASKSAAVNKRQTRLNFSSQATQRTTRGTQSGRAQREALEISDDEIDDDDDDDDDDAFESVPPPRRGRQ